MFSGGGPAPAQRPWPRPRPGFFTPGRNWLAGAASRAQTRRRGDDRGMEKALDTALVWFRRDLRADDHAALFHALKAARQVWCAFVFDRDILDPLPRADRRVEFIRDAVLEVSGALEKLGASHGTIGVRLITAHG